MKTAFALILAVVAYRILSPILGFPPNFAPAMAIAFCAGVWMRGALSLPAAFGALLACDLVLNAHYGLPLLSWEMLFSYGAYLAAWGIGTRVALRANAFTVIGGCLAGSVLFYVLTNTGSFFTNPAYAKTFAGWVQALTTGVPGLPPTWTFFRNSLASDLVFTGVFAAAMALARVRRPVAVAA